MKTAQMSEPFDCQPQPPMSEALLKKSSTTLVLEAVNELHAAEQHATRDTLANVTSLKLGVVDDRLKVLVADEKIHRIRDGLYVPVKQFPPSRPISKTVLPDGRVKIEVGDDMLTLTPREDRTLASMLASSATQLAAIEAGHQAAVMASELAQRIKDLERENRAIRAQIRASAQMTFIADEPVELLGGLKT